MGKKEAKTNAIRILETMKIPYEARTYECDDFVDAAQIADKLGLDHAGMYKTCLLYTSPSPRDRG